MTTTPTTTLATLREAKDWRDESHAAGWETEVRLLDALIDAWRGFEQAGFDMSRELGRIQDESDAVFRQLGDGLHTEVSVGFIAGHAAKLTAAQAARTSAAERVQIIAHVLDVRVQL